MRKGTLIERLQKRFAHFVGALRTHPVVFLKRARRVTASIIAWLIGFLFFGVGLWILLLRSEGLVDLVRPHNMSIGQINVDGSEGKGYAELLRARFDYHFRRPAALPKETGFLEAVALDSPELFQQQGLAAPLEKMTVEVSGVDVAKVVQLVNTLAKPDQWVVEGDIQTRSDRAMLALRMSRGDRLIRTWYLERFGDTDKDKPMLIEQLIDDAIFQLVYDFGNDAEKNPDLQKWRNVVPAPTHFPTAAAAAAYYKGRGALGRYYAEGDWSDLDIAVEQLRLLRGQMPEYEDGLELLGLALTEQRNETEAIHVYEQLRLRLQPADSQWNSLTALQKRRLLSIELMQAIATTKLYTWQSTHDAIAQLQSIANRIDGERAVATTPKDKKDKAALSELMGQTGAQLSYAYAIYLAHLRNYTVAEIFGNQDAPAGLRVTDAREIATLRDKDKPAEARAIVVRVVRAIAAQHQRWMQRAEQELTGLQSQWHELSNHTRRQAELVMRMRLSSGYANYLMAEWESHDADAAHSIFGKTFNERLNDAAKELSRADAAHPNHYLVLEMLGLVNGEPRRQGQSLNIAEQYFERAIRASPSDYYGHELLSGVLYQRAINRGIDLSSRPALEKGLKIAQEAIDRREISGTAHLLRAEFEALMLEIEVDATKQRELRSSLEQHLDQAARFLPVAFGRPDPELTWLRIVATTRRFGEQANNGDHAAATDAQEPSKAKKTQKFNRSRDELLAEVDKLIADCKQIEARWVSQQRVFQIKKLHEKADRLRTEIAQATTDNWRELHIPL